MPSDKRDHKKKRRYPPGPLYRFVGPRYWPLWIGLVALRILVFLPLRWQLWLGRRLGGILYLALQGRRFFARRNLEICFPELDSNAVERLLKLNFRSLGMSVFETGMAWWASGRRLKGYYTINGIEEIERALQHGRGALLLTAHFTSLELCGRMLNNAGVSYDAMYRRHNNPLLEEITRRGREKCARTVIAKKDVRGIVRSLRANRPVWYAPDQSYRRRMSAVVNFFGEPAVSNTATTAIAQATGTTIVPFFGRRQGDGPRYILTVEPALAGFPGSNPIDDTQRINELIESWIRQCPEQYYWVHRRFKKRPDSFPDAYRKSARRS